MASSLMEIANNISLNGGPILRNSGRYGSSNQRTPSQNYDIIDGEYKSNIDDCDCHPGDCSDCICMDCNDCEYS